MNSQVFYIAGMGAVTSVGGTLKHSAAAINADISSYAVSDYHDKNFNPVKMAKLPDGFFVDEGEHINLLAYKQKLIKMAQQAITESCALCSPQKIIPTLLALPELTPKTQNELASDFNGLAQEIINICQPWVCAEYFRTIHGGRCAGIAALDFAFKYLANEQHDYVLMGASDSHIQLSRLDDLDVHNRLLTEKNSDGFVVGEGACFLMLTRHPRLAEQRDGCIVALHPPGIAHEAGHLYSSEPCLGAGLDQAYKSAISHYYSSGSTNGDKISAIYSGINGERYWSKESGVARLRNRAAFLEAAAVYHPADCVGDLGAATSTLLIALAAEHLLRHKNETRHLIASSSDYGGRGAVVIEKIPI